MSSSGISSPGASPSRILSKDIFDVCRPIKEQLEAMQALYGEESIFNLTTPVLVALEELERYKMLYEEEKHRAGELLLANERFERDLRLKHDEKMRLQQDLVQMEASSQEELVTAYDAMRSLKNENRILKQRIDSATELAIEAAEQQSQATSTPSEEEVQVMIDLRKRYIKEHALVTELQDQLASEQARVDELRENVEKLFRQNKELLRKNKSLVQQGKMLIQEKTEINRRWDQLNKEYIRTRNALNETRLTCKDLESESDSRFAGDDVPKFTEKELQEVFMSKVKLIERVQELELQLERCKASSPSDSEKMDDIMSRPSSTNSVETDKSSKSQSSEECLIYGPINREPDEKLYPHVYEKKESGVRKFFASFFKNMNSPRRGSSATNLGP